MRLIAFSLAAGLVAQSASAQGAQRVAPMNGKLIIRNLAAINPDCTSAGYATLRVVDGPANGVISTVKKPVFTYFPPSNPRSACNKRRVPGIEISYRPHRDFVGPDSFSLEVITPDGVDLKGTFNVDVK